MTKITGTFLHIVYSPKGGVEGFLLESAGEIAQFVLDKGDTTAADIAATLRPGQKVVVSADSLPKSPKGAGQHPVHGLLKVVSIDGKRPAAASSLEAGYAGTVVRLNYARHGAPNGYVLDSGDFVHVKPDGFCKLRLSVGDSVSAEGDAQFLATGNGWAVEAESINGKMLK